VGPARVSSPQVDLTRCGLDKTLLSYLCSPGVLHPPSEGEESIVERTLPQGKRNYAGSRRNTKRKHQIPLKFAHVGVGCLQSRRRRGGGKEEDEERLRLLSKTHEAIANYRCRIDTNEKGAPTR
jgi:hypothetical protein